jgi:hypothetical protein
MIYGDHNVHVCGALKAQSGIVIPPKNQGNALFRDLLDSMLLNLFFLFLKNPSMRLTEIDLLRKPVIKETVRKHKLEISIYLKV